MRRSFAPFAVAASLALACAAAPRQPAPAKGPLAPVAFLSGDWIATTAEGEVLESWGPPRGDAMLGTSHTVADGRTVFFEYVRIEARPAGIVYLASPVGRDPPTPFPLREASANRVVFANDEHDFPQRVIYERQGDRLHARIEGKVGGKPKTSTWSYRRVR